MIKDRVINIKGRIQSVCAKVNKDPDSITIVAISKGSSVAQIIEAIQAGIDNIGENRVREAILKYKELSAINHQLSAVKWHMVGHLQTNKVKDAVRIFDLIHSVDSVKLAEEIDRQAARINKIQDILIEVKTSNEATKFGLKPDEAIGVIEEIAKLKNVSIRGLMAMAPLVDDPEKTRPYFRMLRELKDKINELSAVSFQLSALSMGMTDDFQVAIEEGATMVRLGRAIFGDS